MMQGDDAVFHVLLVPQSRHGGTISYSTVDDMLRSVGKTYQYLA